MSLKNERVTSQIWVVLLIGHVAWASQIWVVTHHQYGISTLVSQTSFGGETGSSVAKCQLFSQARSVNQIVLFNGFLSDFAEITSCIYTKTIILFNLGE